MGDPLAQIAVPTGWQSQNVSNKPYLAVNAQGQIIASFPEQGRLVVFGADGQQIKEIPLPESLEPIVSYSAAVTRGAAHPALARAFISGLLTGTGRRYLLSAGFLPPLAR